MDHVPSWCLNNQLFSRPQHVPHREHSLQPKTQHCLLLRCDSLQVLAEVATVTFQETLPTGTERHNGAKSRFLNAHKPSFFSSPSLHSLFIPFFFSSFISYFLPFIFLFPSLCPLALLNLWLSNPLDVSIPLSLSLSHFKNLTKSISMHP